MTLLPPIPKKVKMGLLGAYMFFNVFGLAIGLEWWRILSMTSLLFLAFFGAAIQGWSANPDNGKVLPVDLPEAKVHE